nr:anti-sigma factor [Thioalkalivibrio sp. XN8]
MRSRLEADAAAWLGGKDAAPAAAAAAPRAADIVPLRSRPAAATAWGGWLAAAAAVVIAVIGWLQVDRMESQRAELAASQDALEGVVARLERNVTAKDEALAALREPTAQEMLAELQGRPGTRVISWSATEDPAAAGADGAVIWNGETQAGVMRFEGLQPNDPAEWQYQLWIFDAERDERFPVDGGVFDVSADGETLVPIRASLPVGKAVLFAITVEQPGGVVVSSRERIALVAQPDA